MRAFFVSDSEGWRQYTSEGNGIRPGIAKALCARRGRKRLGRNRADVITSEKSPLFEIARVLVRLDHVASVIINANHSIMWAAAVHCVADCMKGRRPYPALYQSLVY
jgi:hypothetical protein